MATALHPSPGPLLAAAAAPAATGPDASGPSADAGSRGDPASQQRDEQASLRSLRLVLALCLLVPVLLFVVFGAYRWQQVHEEAELRLDRALRIALEHALKVLETNEAMLGHILDIARAEDDESIRAREPAIHAQLKALAAEKPQVQSIRVMDSAGRAAATSNLSPPPAGVQTDLESFQWHRGNPDPRPFFAETAVGQVTGELYFSMSRGRYRSDSRFAGLVSVALKPSYFASFHKELAANEPGLAITMFRRDGAVYSRWPSLPTRPTRMGESSEVLQRVLNGQNAGAIRSVSSLDKQERLILFRQLGSYPVYLGTGLELSAIRANWRNEMALIAAFGAVPVAGLVISALLAMRRTREALEAARRLHEEAHARRQMEEALLQAQKLEALGRLTGGVAHDFNNALMVISGNLHLMRASQQGGPTKYADAIGRAVDSATKLTRQLLAFSRRQALLPQTVRLQERLPPLKDLLAPVLGSQVRLEVDVARDTPAVRVDVAEFELGLINLAVNARDAMPGGGSFEIRARRIEEPPPGVQLRGPAVVVEVSDTGSGIPPHVLGKVFEPFFTTKAVGQGTGLGLSQVYALCQRSGGTALIESEVGKGTTVRLFFPPAPDDALDPRDATLPAPQRLDLDVLMVEDNDDVAATVQPVLEALGCKVVRMDRADAARDWLARASVLPDVLLTDVVMPGEMDGVALARLVRDRYPAVRILVMTGYAQQLESISQQGFHILPKPWTAEMLAQALRTPPA